MNSTSGHWNLLSSRVVLDSPWLKVRENSYELPNGSVIPRYYISERNDSAVCVCFTGEHFVLVRQYRPGIQRSTLCHPGGRLESEDASPVTGALRELLEETGYRPDSVEPLGSFAQIPAVSTARVHLFLVYCMLTVTSAAKPDATEDLRLELMTPAQLQDAIESGDMDCMACVAATYRAIQHRDRNGR